MGRLAWHEESSEAFAGQENELAELQSRIQNAVSAAKEYLDNNYKASDQSYQALNNFIKNQVLLFVSGERPPRVDSPALVRIPKHEDPGDNPNVAAFEIWTDEIAPSLAKVADSAEGTLLYMKITNFALHWLATLPLEGKAPGIAKDISKRAGDATDNEGLIALMITERLGHRPDYSVRRVLREIDESFQEHNQSIKEALPEQVYSGMEKPIPQRLKDALDFVEQYVSYLESGNFDKVNLIELVIVLRVVFDQFNYSSEFFQSDGARTVTRNIHEEVERYIDSLTSQMKRADSLDYSKELAIKSMRNVFESLEIALRLEDGSYERRSPQGSNMQEAVSGTGSWEDTPLDYDDWVRKAPKTIKDLGETDRSFQWALYVFQLDTRPDKETRRGVLRDLTKRFHPDVEGGDEEVMKLVNGAYDILRLE
ncbi:MAG: J domain-containing protein [Pseudomonadota bacterium]